MYITLIATGTILTSSHPKNEETEAWTNQTICHTATNWQSQLQTQILTLGPCQ